MKRVVEELRSAVDPAVHVLLRGEPGVGKELLARSLHLSGPRRNGPFVVASCSGAKPSQIEADLFGAEVGAGRGSWSSPTAAPCSWPTGRGRSSSGRGGRSSSAPRPSVSGKAATSRGRRSSTSPTRPERAPSSASSTRCARRTSSGASPRTLTAMPRSGPRKSSSATSRTRRTCRDGPGRARHLSSSHNRFVVPQSCCTTSRRAHGGSAGSLSGTGFNFQPPLPGGISVRS